MAVQACDFLLQADLVAPCDGLSSSGLKNAGYIVNYDDVDWDNITKDSQNPNIVKNFLLKSGKNAYKVYVPGKTPYTGTNKALATGTYRNKFTKQVKLVVLSNGAGVCHDIIDQLANGRFVVILENDFQGATKDNTFEFYGLELGCAATEMSDDKYSEDTDGGWAVTLEETNAPTSGIFYLKDGDQSSSAIEVTRAALEALLPAEQSANDNG